ncbi:lysine--tRNA ligase [Massilia sp. H-1]|nr:lysine--tRNA ligase [Massilia sp. H-1]
MTTDIQDQAAAPADENKIIAERRAKLATIREKGIAFPNDFRPQHKAAELVEQHGEKTREELEANVVPVVMAGRMMLHREAGKRPYSPCCRIRRARAPMAASRSTSRSTPPAKPAMEALRTYDLGDILGVEGSLFKTKTGELTVKVNQLRLITKSLRPLPDKFHGLADQETKYRQRYVDMIMSEETRRTFKARTAAMSSIRRFMEKHDFMEVETPMLHTIPGGAAAKPFITHHNALDMEMFLRIAPELYLKRLVVGGFDRVFEVNRNFRNEGVSPRHNPEFTMMEFYAAYTDYQWIMNFTEEVIRQAAVDAHGTAVLTYGGRELDLSKPFHRMTIVQAINKFAPHYTNEQLHDMDFLKAELLKFGVKPFSTSGLGALQLSLFEETAEAQLWEPTFIIDYPAGSIAAGTRFRHDHAASPSASNCSWWAARSPTASRS